MLISIQVIDPVARTMLFTETVNRHEKQFLFNNRRPQSN